MTFFSSLSYYYEHMFVNIYLFQSIAVIILADPQMDPSLASGSLLSWRLNPFDAL